MSFQSKSSFLDVSEDHNPNENQEIVIVNKTPLKSSKAQDNWNRVQLSVFHTTLNNYVNEIKSNILSPTKESVAKLGFLLINESSRRRDKWINQLYVGTVIVDWAIDKLQYELQQTELVILARSHNLIWMVKGVESEHYNLERSKKLYEKSLLHLPNLDKASILLEYSRVLQFSGELDKATIICKKVLKDFDNDDDFPSYLFFAGSLMKAQGLHNEAANYFFEATQIGPPKFFNKLEMMFIISRNIEESGKDSDTPSEDAYQMVYDHLIMEGEISDDVLYEDWLTDAATWRNLADKCLLHGLYSLSADLYGQGLLRDSYAFQKPMLWFGFAKACNRCGRSSDAQLSIKQALTISPYNRQLKFAYLCWSQELTKFMEWLEKDLATILDSIPIPIHLGLKGIKRIQSVYRAQVQRKQLLEMKNIPGGLKKLSAKCGILFKSRPVLIKVYADMIGTIQELLLFDSNNYEHEIIKLPEPFAPMKNLKRNLILSINCSTVDMDGRNSWCEYVVTLNYSDSISKEFIEKKFLLRYSPSEQIKTTIGDYKVVTYEKSLVESVSISVPPNCSITTDIVDQELVRGVYKRDEDLYLYRYYQVEKISNITMLRVETGNRIRFTMPREHFNRNFDFSYGIDQLIDAVAEIPLIATLLELTPINEPDPNFHHVKLDDYVPAFKTKIEIGANVINCMISVEYGCSALVEVIDTNFSLISNSFEQVIDTALSNPNAPSRAKRSARELMTQMSISRGNISLHSRGGHSVDSRGFSHNISKDSIIGARYDHDDDDDDDAKGKFPVKSDSMNLNESSLDNVDGLLGDNSLILGGGLEEDSMLLTGKGHSTSSVEFVSPLKPADKTLSKTPLTDLKTSESKMGSPEGKISKSKKVSLEGSPFPSSTKESAGKVTPRENNSPVINLTHQERESPNKKSRKFRLKVKKTPGMEPSNSSVIAEDVKPTENLPIVSKPGARKVVQNDSVTALYSTENEDIGQSSQINLNGSMDEILDMDVEGIKNEGEEDAIPVILTKAEIKAEKARQKAAAKEKKLKEKILLKKKNQQEAEIAAELRRQEMEKNPVVTEEEAQRQAFHAHIVETSEAVNNLQSSSKLDPKVSVAQRKARKFLLICARKALHKDNIRLCFAFLCARSIVAVREYSSVLIEEKIRLDKLKAEANLSIEQQQLAEKARQYQALKKACNKVAVALFDAIVIEVMPSAVEKKIILNFEARLRQEEQAIKRKAKREEAINAAKSIESKLVEQFREMTAVDALVFTNTDTVISLGNKLALGKTTEDIIKEIAISWEAKERKETNKEKFLEYSRNADANPNLDNTSLSSITSSQKQKLAQMAVRRGLKVTAPLNIEDLPTSAYESAQGLVKALQISDIQIKGLKNNNIIQNDSNHYDMNVNRLKPGELDKKKNAEARKLLDSILASPVATVGHVQSRAVSSKGGKRPGAEPELDPKTSQKLDLLLNLNRDEVNNNMKRFVHNINGPPPINSTLTNKSSLLQNPSLYRQDLTLPPKLPSPESALINPVAFMEPVITPSGPLFRQSIVDYKALGYTQGEDAYSLYWKQKVMECLQYFRDGALLRKAITNLQKINRVGPSLSRMEAFCALAESNGNIGEALGKLSNPDFCSELKLVSTLLPAEDITVMLTSIGNNLEDSRKFSQTGGKLTHNGHAAFKKDILDNDFKKFTTSHKEKDFTPKGIENHKFKLLRVKGMEASKSLPHLGLMQTSPAIVKRGSSFYTGKKIVSQTLEENEFQSFNNSFHNDLASANRPISPVNLSYSTLSPPAPDIHTSPKKTIRLKHNIDTIFETSSPNMQVLARKDALLACEDEILSRSPNPQFNKLSSKFKKNKKNNSISSPQ